MLNQFPLYIAFHTSTSQAWPIYPYKARLTLTNSRDSLTTPSPDLAAGTVELILKMQLAGQL